MVYIAYRLALDRAIGPHKLVAGVESPSNAVEL